MNYNINHELKDGYLLLTAKGVITQDEIGPIIIKAYKHCYENQITKLFVDARSVEGQFSIEDRFKFGQTMGDLQINFKNIFGVDFKIAFVVSENILEPNRIGEMVGKSRGANLKVDTDYESAKIWLLE